MALSRGFLEHFKELDDPRVPHGNLRHKLEDIFALSILGVICGADIASLKGWNGHNGTNYATDKELYAALKKGSYDGGWIIPTRDILSGKDVDGKETTPDNLYAHKDKGSLKGTFCTAASSGSGCPDWYWSSTEHRNYSSLVGTVRFSDGSEDWNHKDVNRLSCRPVRLVAVSAGL